MPFDNHYPTPEQYQVESAQEAGLPFPSPSADSGPLPPGGGRPGVPHFISFSQLVNYFTRTYRYTHDEAVRHSLANALALRREPVVMDALRTVQIPVVQLSWHLEPQDNTDERQAVCAEKLTKTIEAIPRFQQFKRCLLEALFYGRYGVQIAYAWSFQRGYKEMVVRQWWPVNGDKLVYRFSGQVGILVHAAYAGPDTELSDRGRAKFFSPSEREEIVIHEFEPEDADFFEADMAGAVHGVGFRGRLYWLFWLRMQVLSWLMDYLQRVGAGGFFLYFYEHGNPASYNEVLSRAQETAQSGVNFILFPRYRDKSTGGPGLEVVQPNLAGAQLLRDLVMDYFDNVIRRYIVGGSNDDARTAVGEGVADLHAGEFARRVKYHAIDLEETLTAELVGPMNKYTFRGNPCPRFKFDIDKPNVDEFMESVKHFFEMGGQIDEEHVRETLGLPDPEPGHGILQKIAPQAPVGVTPSAVAPEGVPFEGEPGPVDQTGGSMSEQVSAGPVAGPQVGGVVNVA